MGRAKNLILKSTRTLKKAIKRMPRHIRRPIGLLFGVLLFLGILVHMQSRREIYVADLLDTIARVESRDNYNAYFGVPRNQTIRFTEMSIDDVLAWQQQYVAAGSASSAVGRYQFINTTLKSLAAELNIEGTELFDQELQDRLATALLQRRGLSGYIDGKLSREQFAHNLSKEWAALPRVIGDNPEQSFYDGDGLNEALVSPEEIYKGIETLREL